MNNTIDDKIIYKPPVISIQLLMISFYIVIGQMNNNVNSFLIGTTVMYILFHLL